jgi:hypothetical protein
MEEMELMEQMEPMELMALTEETEPTEQMELMEATVLTVPMALMEPTVTLLVSRIARTTHLASATMSPSMVARTGLGNATAHPKTRRI